MKKDLRLSLTRREYDYLQEALDWHSNDGSTRMADQIGQKLVDAWNGAEQDGLYPTDDIYKETANFWGGEEEHGNADT